MKVITLIKNGRFILLLAVSALLMFAVEVQGAKPKVLLDTDVGSDVDDAGVIAVLHALADMGEIEFIGICSVNPHNNAVPYIDALNTFFGRPDLPVGIRKGPMTEFDRDHYMADIVKSYPNNLTRSEAPDAVTFYKDILSKVPDKSVTLVVVGQCTNIANLLKASGGKALLQKKVAFYAAAGNGQSALKPMCGTLGPQETNRAGHNYRTDDISAKYVMENLPTNFECVFAGGSGRFIEVGDKLKELPSNDIIRRSYRAYWDHRDGRPNLDRMCWDQLRAIYAALPVAREHFKTSENGTITVQPGGYKNTTIRFAASPDHNRYFAYVKESSETAITNMLNDLMNYRAGKTAPEPEPFKQE